MADSRFGPSPRGRTDDWHPLARWRFVRGLTQEQLAKSSGVGRVTIARVEGGADPRLTTALRLALALGLPVEDIWTLDGKPSKALKTAEQQTRHD